MCLAQRHRGRRLCVCVCVCNKHLQSGCLLTPELSGSCSLCDATLTDQSETEEMTTDVNVIVCLCVTDPVLIIPGFEARVCDLVLKSWKMTEWISFNIQLWPPAHPSVQLFSVLQPPLIPRSPDLFLIFQFTLWTNTINTSVLSQSESRMTKQHQRLDPETNWTRIKTTEEQNSWLLQLCCLLFVVVGVVGSGGVVVLLLLFFVLLLKLWRCLLLSGVVGLVQPAVSA